MSKKHLYIPCDIESVINIVSCCCVSKTVSICMCVAKMASHAIFQNNILVIDDTHNTWTNICVKMIIIRLIGPRDEKIQNPEEIGSKGPRQR